MDVIRDEEEPKWSLLKWPGSAVWYQPPPGSTGHGQPVTPIASPEYGASPHKFRAKQEPSAQKKQRAEKLKALAADSNAAGPSSQAGASGDGVRLGGYDGPKTAEAEGAGTKKRKTEAETEATKDTKGAGGSTGAGEEEGEDGAASEGSIVGQGSEG